MREKLTITTERVDDIPVLLAQSDRMGIAELLDVYFRPHGNWEGTGLGLTTTIWLTHILSEGDHRMNQVQPWVATRLHTLQKCSGQAVRDQEWSDDRLSLVLDALSDDRERERCVPREAGHLGTSLAGVRVTMPVHGSKPGWSAGVGTPLHPSQYSLLKSAIPP